MPSSTKRPVSLEPYDDAEWLAVDEAAIEAAAPRRGRRATRAPTRGARRRDAADVSPSSTSGSPRTSRGLRQARKLVPKMVDKSAETTQSLRARPEAQKLESSDESDDDVDDFLLQTTEAAAAPPPRRPPEEEGPVARPLLQTPRRRDGGVATLTTSTAGRGARARRDPRLLAIVAREVPTGPFKLTDDERWPNTGGCKAGARPSANGPT